MSHRMNSFVLVLMSLVLLGLWGCKKDTTDSDPSSSISEVEKEVSLVDAVSDESGDWPMWGYGLSRNMVSPVKNIAEFFDPGEMDDETEIVDMSTTKNIKWIAKVGSQCYGNVTVANGLVFVGTNNETPRNLDQKGDRGVVMCFKEETGEFLWQLLVPKLGAGKVSDWEYLGICSSPAVDGDRVYVITNRCEVICLDVAGLANGNDGAFQEEGQYIAGAGKPAAELTATDADIIWVYDMRKELGVFPHNITSSSILVVGDKVFATTSNGQDWSHVNIPSPRAPTLICLDKKTGKLLGEEASGISARILHCNWSSPAYGKVGDQEMVIFGAGDGFCYGFDPEPVEEDGFGIFKELWRYDCNPPEHKTKKGKPIKYPRAEGPSELIASPVFYNNRVYALVGQDPEHGQGVGCLSCIDASGTGDISESGVVWKYTGIDRSISTVSIADGLVFAADYTGMVHCLDADTGEVYWVHDTESAIWASTLVVDGKLYIGTEDGQMIILKAQKELKVVQEIEMGAPIYSSAVAANGVLYVATMTHLYAIAGSL